jgi:hypothetical protein
LPPRFTSCAARVGSSNGAVMSTKRPSELDIQDRVADAIWFVPQSDDAQAHYVLEYSGRGPKAYLNLWLGSNYGEELTEWNWILHESAVELWRRDSTDEEIIEVLLPDQEQRHEISELRAENEQLRVDNDLLRMDIERLVEDRDRPEVLPSQVQRISENQLKLLGELRAENARLRAAAQAVIDSINDENEIDPDAVYRLSQSLLSDAARPGTAP